MEIYLDNCATTKVCEEAVHACVFAMTQSYGNPSSLHRKGLEAETILTDTRKAIGKMLGVEPSCICFTANASESNNLAILGSAAAHPRAGKTILTTSVEHSSVSQAGDALKAKGYQVKHVSPRQDGQFYAEDFLEAADEDTLLLSFQMVNNEIGTILPYEQIVSAFRKKWPKILLHLDAVQGFLKYPLNLKRLDLDFLTFSGHKLYAPKGIGVLYCKKGVRLSPLAFGGGQEMGLRPGTQAVELIAALKEALLLCDVGRERHMELFASLNKRLREGLQTLDGVFVNSPDNGAPYILNLSVLGVRSEIMLHYLEARGISVSSGSACSKGAKSPVLKAYGFSPERMDSALRISFSKDNTPEEIDLFLTALREGAEKLRGVINRSRS